ncbi:MAG: ABC transporter ATP-binding protein [Burkholderiaceae bacterium]|nr:ABC transporter ATP-binding protein [Burkholderiaceae bacterium]
MLLEVRNLEVGYGDATAVWGVSLQVEKGSIATVIGPNGAGKSTLINAIAGLLPWKSGDVLMDGTSLSGVPAHQFCERGIALIPEGRRLFVGMTVEENLDIGCYRSAARLHREASLDSVYARFPVLKEKRLQPAGQLSGGQQQMVAIGRALMARPRLMLFDEPSLGLAPAIVDEMFDIIEDIRAEGVAVLLVEQNVQKSLEAAQWAYVLEHGRIVAAGVPSDLLGQAHIQQAYLGL